MRTSRRTILALAATLTITAAACGDDSNDSAPTGAPVATEAPAETEMADDEMTDDEMTDDEMADDDMTDDDVAEDEMADDDMTDDETADDEMTHTAATDDGASTLRAGLTSLLQEHVLLAGIAFETAIDNGGDLEHPEVVGAVDALDENTVALADAVGSVAGDENGDAFLGLWRQHIGFFVDYTLGEATGNQDMKDQALTDLAGYQQAAGAFFEEITGGEIQADVLIGGLEEHVNTLTAAIDAIVADSPQQFALLKIASDHMFGAADLLATGIVAAVPDTFPGATDSAPAETRAILTKQLQEHAYLAGIAIEQAIDAGGDLENPVVAAAVETLDANSVELAETVASVAGEENGDAFLGLWRQHIGFFVDYTLGEATGDQDMKDQALTDLAGYQQAAGAFFEEITGGKITPEMLIPGLEEHVVTLTAAIDAMVAGDAEQFSLLRTAGQHMPMAALLLSTGIVAATS